MNPLCSSLQDQHESTTNQLRILGIAQEFDQDLYKNLKTGYELDTNLARILGIQQELIKIPARICT